MRQHDWPTSPSRRDIPGILSIGRVERQGLTAAAAVDEYLGATQLIHQGILSAREALVQYIRWE